MEQKKSDYEQFEEYLINKTKDNKNNLLTFEHSFVLENINKEDVPKIKEEDNETKINKKFEDFLIKKIKHFKKNNFEDFLIKKIQYLQTNNNISELIKKLSESIIEKTKFYNFLFSEKVTILYNILASLPENFDFNNDDSVNKIVVDNIWKMKNKKERNNYFSNKEENFEDNVADVVLENKDNINFSEIDFTLQEYPNEFVKEYVTIINKIRGPKKELDNTTKEKLGQILIQLKQKYNITNQNTFEDNRLKTSIREFVQKKIGVDKND